MTIEKFKKEILIGLSPDNQAVALELSIGDNYNREENQYFSLCGSEYNMNDVFTEEEGEDRAREYLESDDELWKSAVEAGDTTSSLEDFNDDILNIGGWESVLGDVHEIGNGYHVMYGSGGQIDNHLNKNPKEWKKLLISEQEFNDIFYAWTMLHLKHIVDFNEVEKQLMQNVKGIFEKYEGFSYEDLKQFINLEEIEE